jgi:biotin synthase-related radical SAM superfamily protein
MVLEVVLGNSENKKGREFYNLKEATYYIDFNEKSAKASLGNDLGEIIEYKPKHKNEIIRKVYQNACGVKRHYIIRVVH